MPVNLSSLKHIKTTLEELLEKLDVQADIAIRASDELIFVEVTSCKPQSGILIGRNGETLLSLQLLLSLIVSRKYGEQQLPIILDVEGFRQRREKELTAAAHQWAQQVIEKNEPLALVPMKPFERRIIHLALKEYSELVTESVGEEPFRKIVIKPKSA